jgi:hypothetical protein
MSVNLSNSTPAAPTGATNVLWQTDGSGNISGYVSGSASVVTNTVLPILQPTLTANYNAGSAQTIYTPSAVTVLRVNWSQAIVVAATTGAATSTFPSLTLSWTDVGGITRTQTLVPTSTANTTAVQSQGVTVIYTNNSGPVAVTSASYASNTASQMQYALTVFAEIL